MNRQHIDFHNYSLLSHLFTNKTLITELVRKTIHMMSALTVILAYYWYTPTIFALICGIVVYSISELLRIHHYTIFLVTAITSLAERDRDKGHFVYGPVTLAIGILISLLLYPLHTAKLAVYALAFGDGLASLVGKTFGTTRICFTRDKTIAGSSACFFAVIFISFMISASIWKSLILAALTTIIEMLPLRDYDNIFIPLVVGCAAYIINA